MKISPANAERFLAAPPEGTIAVLFYGPDNGLVRERARALGATLRVAYLISGAMPDVVGRTRIEARGEKLTLVLPGDLGPLAGGRVLRRLSQLAKLAGMDADIEVM